MENTYHKLCNDALYAIRSNNESLIYECLGAARMAKVLDAINAAEFRHIEKALIPGWINNVAHRKELMDTITLKDIEEA